MSKYRVIRNGYGFQGRYWEIGLIVELDPSEKPPKYFQMIEDVTVPVSVPAPEPEVEQHEVQVQTKRRGRKRK